MQDMFVNMIPENSIDRLSSFLLLLSLCCINRSFWFQKRNCKILGHVIFLVSVTAVIISLIVEINYKNNEEDQEKSPFVIHLIILFETMLIAVAAVKFRNSLKTMKTLDEKCYIPGSFKYDPFEKFVDNKSSTLMIIRLSTMIVDVMALKILNFSICTIIILSIGFAAHDTEIVFCSLLINELNDKLAKLTTVDATTGTRIFRHVLIGSSRFTEDYNFLVAIMIFFSLIISLIFGVIATESKSMRLEDFSDLYLIIYIYLREAKYLYTIWILCRAAYKTRQLCVQLAQFLTMKLVFDLDKEDKNYKLTKRWLACVKSYEIKYSDTKKYSISLKLPLVLLNLISNNLLVISKIHNAIKKANSD